MTIGKSYIYIKNLRVHSYHGVLPQERLTGNDYILNLRVEYPVDSAMKSDDVKDTANYATICNLINEEMEQQSCLIENVAYRIGKRLFGEMPEIRTLDIKLMKVNPPMSVDCDGAGIELHLINDKTI
jgi:dihydroneopterin aldolase